MLFTYQSGLPCGVATLPMKNNDLTINLRIYATTLLSRYPSLQGLQPFAL